MEHMVPLLYCKSLNQTLAFYQVLGFTVTYRQDDPYPYAAISRGEVQLHFTRRTKAAACLIFVDDSAAYHRAIADALRAKYRSIPTANFPRLTRFKAGDTRFRLFDPSGNVLYYINHDESDYDSTTYNAAPSSLLQALDNAIFLRDTYAEDKAAVRVLDLALKRSSSAAPIDLARVIAARAELAVALDDLEGANRFRDELKQIPLSDDEREQWQDELNAADELERWRTQPPQNYTSKPNGTFKRQAV